MIGDELYSWVRYGVMRYGSFDRCLFLGVSRGDALRFAWLMTYRLVCWRHNISPISAHDVLSLSDASISSRTAMHR